MFTNDSFNGKGFSAESHAYSYAYNEGHSDSRKDDGYNPIKSKQELADFKRVLKQKGAESFNASMTHTDLLEWCEDYLWENDKKGYQAYHEVRRSYGFDAESNYPKGEKGYVLYSLGYNDGKQGEGRKTHESFVSMIAKFNDIENSYMLSDDDNAYTIYTLGVFDGESDKIAKRTPQAFELMVSKLGKSYGKPLLSSIPKTARLDAESYCHNHKTCGGYRVEGTFLCWPCHDIEADVRIAKRNDAESFSADWQTNDKFWNMLYEEHEYLFDEDGMVDYPMEQLAEIAKDMGFDAETFEATKGIDTFTEPFEEMGVPKWLIGIGGVVAAITGINYLSKKL